MSQTLAHVVVVVIVVIAAPPGRRAKVAVACVSVSMTEGRQTQKGMTRGPPSLAAVWVCLRLLCKFTPGGLGTPFVIALCK